MYLTIQEVNLELRKLSRDDWRKLLRQAKWLTYGNADKAEELLQEVCVRLLSGKRKCPAKIPLPVVIICIMMSLVSHAQKKEVALQPLIDALLADDDQHAQILAQQVVESFENDPEDYKFLNALLIGLSERELMRNFNLTESQLRAWKRKIRDRIRALLSNRKDLHRD